MDPPEMKSDGILPHFKHCEQKEGIKVIVQDAVASFDQFLAKHFDWNDYNSETSRLGF